MSSQDMMQSGGSNAPEHLPASEQVANTFHLRRSKVTNQQVSMLVYNGMTRKIAESPDSIMDLGAKRPLEQDHWTATPRRKLQTTGKTIRTIQTQARHNFSPSLPLIPQVSRRLSHIPHVKLSLPQEVQENQTAKQPSTQLRWPSQACMIYLALRDHPEHAMPRTELINAALAWDNTISKGRNFPLAFRGKTPKNSASAILTNDHGRHFQSFRPDGSKSMHFRLTFKPADFSKAAEQYREWMTILITRDWPLCFGRPYAASYDDTDQALPSTDTLYTAATTKTATTTTTATATSSVSSSSPGSSTASSSTSSPSSPISPAMLLSSHHTSLDQRSQAFYPRLLMSAYHPPFSSTTSTTHIEHPDEKANSNSNEACQFSAQDEHNLTEFDRFIINRQQIPQEQYATEFDQFIAHRQRERLYLRLLNESKEEQTEIPSMSTIRTLDNTGTGQQSICESIHWRIHGDSYYATNDTPDIPTCWQDIVRVESKSTRDNEYALYARRRLPPNTPVGFYFGTPTTEDEFELYKERQGRAAEYCVMYGRTVLDATDEQGQLFVDPTKEQMKMYCPFHFMRQADTPFMANVMLLKGKTCNQVVCWTKREIHKNEELLIWLEYGQ